jgi:VWFA-related protein
MLNLTRSSAKSALLLNQLPASLFAITLLSGLTLSAQSQPAQSQPAPSPASASSTMPATTISIDVKVVNLPVTVRDKHGQVVRDLTKDDFTLQEDGRPQTIKYFSQETNLPLTFGLLVDTSLSQRNVLNDERTASKAFLEKMLANEKDRAFLIHFDREVELLQDLTSSKEKLETALERMSSPSFKGSTQSDPDDQTSGGRSHHSGAGTLLYDAVYLASNELMKKQPGRKALIVLTDGVDHGSKESLENAIEAAQRADTIVYSILFKDQNHENSGFGRGAGRGGYPGGGGGWPGGGGGYPGGSGRHGGGGRNPQEAHVDGKRILERISQETGGRMFEVTKKEPIDQVYASIADELRQQYSLGYTPTKTDAEAAGYHKITLTAKKKDMTVQTREGYYAER